MSDLISRQATIDTEGLDEQIRCEMCKNPMHTDRGCDGNCKYDEKLYERIMQILGERIKPLPSAQPEQSTEIQEILDYLDTTLHPIVSPNNWNVYAELHDMVSMLPSAHPDHSDEVKFWKERAESYGETCINLLNEINKSVKINSIEVNENGIIFMKEQKRSCDGCKHLGMWENEIEYGYPCPCLRCVRRAGDNYE